MPIIGREPPAEIVIPAPQVSARHAEITFVGEGTYRLQDLGSANGTFVNGQRIQSAMVRMGDHVSLGSFQIDLSAYAHLVPQGQQLAGRPQTQPAHPVGSPTAQPQPVPGAVMPPAAPVQPAVAVQPAPPRQPAVKPPTQQPASVQASPRQQPAFDQPGVGNEIAVALATQKSFVGKAFACWFLYWLFYLPGLVMNLAWLSEAKKVKELTGQSPSGMGCLQLLIFKFVFLPILIVVLTLATGGAFLAGLMSMF